MVHFNPVRLYPPVRNLLGELCDTWEGEVILISSEAFEAPNVRSVSPPTWIGRHSSRVLIYLWWFVKLYLLAFRFAKEKWLLYEASAFPALQLQRGNSRIWLHFHEYRHPANPGSRFERFYERKIRKYIHRPDVVSHVTDARILKLLSEKDENKREYENMWNCPRLSWTEGTRAGHIFESTVVIVGAVSRTSSWSREVFEAFNAQERYKLHVYGKDPFESSAQVKYKGWCDYEELPSVLKKYKVGLVWYNGKSDNFVSGISNKIFEYLHVGLVVILSEDMTEARRVLLPEYCRRIKVLNLGSNAWLRHLDEIFQSDSEACKEYHFSQASEKLLNWIKQ